MTSAEHDALSVREQQVQEYEAMLRRMVMRLLPEATPEETAKAEGLIRQRVQAHRARLAAGDQDRALELMPPLKRTRTHEH